ncbi:LysR family transcriptional regulator [Methylocapsa palsarum]|uniref:DNA-binding transcriptional regulator, LysR family n=1 Tax=Methylocapsa palsarum TaxID=1612308 RepID=A0A1I3VQ41_9HYPH|nr:LysR family transcriptional regulator [Methylocapsa palsarum]SFJ97365.1 DNA-binding transcriptional regulator, LysR family [Methylocapsa palsarum]
MFIRQLEYLVTLARERHFARAAEACCVSQPALSAAIRHLEEELGVSIVERGQRFLGFTEDGERILGWARQALAAWDGLKQEASISRTRLTGTLRLGAIPTTMPIVSLLTGPYWAEYPDLHQMVQSLSNEDIVRRLDNFELDIGVTYLEEQNLTRFRVLPLYRERYVLLARDATLLDKSQSDDGKTITWREAARLPLCLLTRNMQNRRIIDAAFRKAGAHPRVVVETDSVFALYSNVRCAEMFSILPHSLLSLFEMREELTAIALTPELNRAIGLLALDNDPVSPIVSAIWAVTQRLNLGAKFDFLAEADLQTSDPLLAQRFS